MRASAPGAVLAVFWMALGPSKTASRPRQRQLSPPPGSGMSRRQRNDVIFGWPAMGRNGTPVIAWRRRRPAYRLVPPRFPNSSWPSAGCCRSPRRDDADRSAVRPAVAAEPDLKSSDVFAARAEQPIAGKQPAAPARLSSVHRNRLASVSSAVCWDSINQAYA